jgi:hypothetical protein
VTKSLSATAVSYLNYGGLGARGARHKVVAAQHRLSSRLSIILDLNLPVAERCGSWLFALMFIYLSHLLAHKGLGSAGPKGFLVYGAVSKDLRISVYLVSQAIGFGL